jgi:hypothetical protein
LKKTFRLPSPDSLSRIDDLRFEKTIDEMKEVREGSPKVVVRFDGVPFSSAMRVLAEKTGSTIVWDTSLDTELVVGTFFDQPLNSVLETLSRRYKVSLSEVGGIYFLGQYNRGDEVTAVVRIPPVDREELLAGIKQACTENGRVSIVGSVVWLVDSLENVRKILSDIEDIRNRSERSYLAEVFFIRVNENDFLQLTGDLRIRSVDVFSSSFNVSELFQMFVDAQGGLSSAFVDTRPVLYLSEGRKSVFKVGSDIVRERKAVNESGIIETVGYERFSDGISLSLNLSKISEERYSVDLDLSISSFDKKDKSTVPAKTNSVLQSPGLLLKDGGICYAGSLKNRDSSKVFGLFSIGGFSSSDILTIWLRVREVKD